MSEEQKDDNYMMLHTHYEHLHETTQ